MPGFGLTFCRRILVDAATPQLSNDRRGQKCAPSAARACPCPSGRRPGYHIIAGSEVNGSGRCFILARLLPRHRRSGFAWMDGRAAAAGRLASLPPSLLLLRRATNYHTFGSESASTSRPPIARTRPKCERAKTYSIYRSNYTAVLAFYCAHCAE